MVLQSKNIQQKLTASSWVIYKLDNVSVVKIKKQYRKHNMLYVCRQTKCLFHVSLKNQKLLKLNNGAFKIMTCFLVYITHSVGSTSLFYNINALSMQHLTTVVHVFNLLHDQMSLKRRCKSIFRFYYAKDQDTFVYQLIVLVL